MADECRSRTRRELNEEVKNQNGIISLGYQGDEMGSPSIPECGWFFDKSMRKEVSQQRRFPYEKR